MTTNGAILLVEDNEDDVFLMKRALKGANVVNPLYVVEDGQEALDYLGGAGKFADRVLTSSNEASDLSRCYALGANSYVVKPPTPEQLEDLANAFKRYWLEYNQFEQT